MPDASPLAVFDLDHTLLDGDTDLLWCDYLIEQGVLDRASFEARNHAMGERYRAGTVSAREFCGFYVATLAGRSAAQWDALRNSFYARCMQPRLRAAGRACIEAHRAQGHTLVMSTATNRFLAQPAAALLGIQHLMATECRIDAAGRFTGEVDGEPNMREGKVMRLEAWLAARGLAWATTPTTFYSDSSNDAPLLRAVGTAVAVNPDERLRDEARVRGWLVQHWSNAAL